MWNKPAYRPLFWALLLSLLVHWALFGRLTAWLEWDEESSIPIEVKLVQVPPPAARPAAAPPAAKTPPPKPKRKPPAPAPLPPVEKVISPVPAPAASPPPEADDTLPADSVAEAPAPVPELAPEPVAVVPEIAEAEPSAPDEEEPAAAPPRHVEIEYQIVRKGGVAGAEHHRYQVSEDGHYRLHSLAEPKGLLALALSDLVQQSEGTVTAHGLRPDTFLYQYGKNPDKAQKATFDWQSNTLVMEAGSRRQTVPLAEGVQDLMSFMYQFMFVPPLQEMQLAITNGKRLKTYAYGFEGEETLDTRMGQLRCLHIGRSSADGEEKTELWLAADYHYLPVKISKTEKDGTVTERIASRLQLE